MEFYNQSFEMSFETQQTELLRFEFYSLSLKTLKFLEFNLKWKSADPEESFRIVLAYVLKCD